MQSTELSNEQISSFYIQSSFQFLVRGDRRADNLCINTLVNNFFMKKIGGLKMDGVGFTSEVLEEKLTFVTKKLYPSINNIISVGKRLFNNKLLGNKKVVI